MIRRFATERLMPRKFSLLEMWASWFGGIALGVYWHVFWIGLLACLLVVTAMRFEVSYHRRNK